MAFVAGDSMLVNQVTDGSQKPIDLRVTPGGGFQVVWDTSAWNATAGAWIDHTTSYRIFDGAGVPLSDEISDATYQGSAPPVHLQHSIALDDGTILKARVVYAEYSPASELQLQLYDQSGAPLGDPVYKSGMGSNSWVGYGIAQLPNRDIVLVTQTAGKTMGPGEIFAYVLDNTSPDLYAPILAGIAGADGAPAVQPDGNIVVKFNELVELAPSARIDLMTASGEVVDSFDASDGADLSAWVSTVTIDPDITLDPGTEYVLQFASGSVLDASGNAFAGGGFHFTTAGDPAAPPPSGDTTAPSAVYFFPEAGSPLPPDWNLGITFDEDVRAGSGTITLQTAAGEEVQTFAAGDPGLRFDGAAVIIDPAADLQPGTTYKLIVQAGAVVDLAGNAYAGVSGYSFTTAGTAPPPASGDTTAPSAVYIFPEAGSPLQPDWNLGITFDEDVQAGSGTITLRTAAGDVVQTFATASDTGIRFSGASVIIDPAADLQPGTTYELVVSGDAVVDLVGNPYAGLSGYSFTTAG